MLCSSVKDVATIMIQMHSLANKEIKNTGNATALCASGLKLKNRLLNQRSSSVASCLFSQAATRHNKAGHYLMCPKKSMTATREVVELH
jgi:hypothetical protein